MIRYDKEFDVLYIILADTNISMEKFTKDNVVVFENPHGQITGITIFDFKKVIEDASKAAKAFEILKIRKIQERVNQHYEDAERLGYEVLGVFLVGSQNYGLDTPDSDIDTRAIVVPNLNEITKASNVISKVTSYADGQMNIRDIRLIPESFRKGNINDLEILFTKYYKINPKYKKVFNKLLDKRESIARYDERKVVSAAAGMSEKYFKEFCREGNDKELKAAVNVLRLNEFMKKYFDNDPFMNCIEGNNKERFLDLKSGKNIPRDLFKEVDCAHIATKNLKENLLQRPCYVNADLDKLFEEVIKK